MKKTLYILCLTCILTSCASHRLTNTEKYSALPMLIESYYNRYSEFPTSADELVSFTNVYREYWEKETAKDSIETTLAYLHKEKDKLFWKCETTYPWEETDLTILSKRDTIFKDSYSLEGIVAENGLVVKFGRQYSAWNWEYILDQYIEDYFKFPNSLNDFIEYSGLQPLIDTDTVAIDKSREGYGLWGHIDERNSAAVFRYFLNHSDEITWHCEDTLLMIKVNTDTIFYNYLNPGFPCHRFDEIPWEIVMYAPKFYDLNGHITEHYRDDLLSREFRSKTQRYFRMVYPNEVDSSNYDNFHFLQYTKNEGLSVLCKDDNMPSNTEYFKHLERYVKSFAEKHNFGKIVFVAPNLEDTRIGEKNVMRVYLDENNKILVNGHETALEELKDLVKNFITPHPNDNNAPEVEWKTFDNIDSILYSKGIVYFDVDRNALFARYLDVQKEILQAFKERKDELSIKIFKKTYDQLDEEQTKIIINAVPIRVFEEF